MDMYLFHSCFFETTERLSLVNTSFVGVGRGLTEHQLKEAGQCTPKSYMSDDLVFFWVSFSGRTKENVVFCWFPFKTMNKGSNPKNSHIPPPPHYIKSVWFGEACLTPSQFRYPSGGAIKNQNVCLSGFTKYPQ